ncbi:hypothetical protein SPRG_08605 [Saprolegnia parasitica CBS 223.65]|uniref:Myb-like domain-containing protein n=1 Tax=Saprolegnia parasitica (strain CBS 223.65) TaxID=695850 RepID=A0A067CHB8_SAPPC|nr:hypothetical protein SPRG_08605 [Saprolegnia parasitica CBS 223.65]KDO25951.1 hypothetical protein SPRG_08605 [Saprolegnia parasitica CBS 223.65]|eukprot:XP_012203239.1 hypothetical protein SPRG_08605 [Saprolegnia parasitica CBS 223.65]
MDMELDSREESSLRGFLGGQFAHGLHAIDTRSHDESESYYGYARDRVESYHGDRPDDKSWMYPTKVDATRLQRSSSYPTESFAPTIYRKEAKQSSADFAIAYTPTSSRSGHPNISPTGGMSPFRGHDEVANGIMNSTSIPSILFNSGRWSIEEHNRLYKALARSRTISKAVGTRTVLQTRTHAQKFFRKLQKQDELKAMNDDENYLPNGDEVKSAKASKVKPSSAGVSFSGRKTKEEPSYATANATGRLSDPGTYEASNSGRSLTPLSNITEHHMGRSYNQPSSTGHHASPPNPFPSNLFPSISIPPSTNAHLASSIATPTTESSRAFSNMSLGSRSSASPAPASYPPTRGNDQWVDWLLSNIDTIVTKNGRQPNDDGRPSAKSDAAGYLRAGRAFRSASESAVPSLHYRQDTNEPSQQQQHGSWEVNGNHHGNNYYRDDDEHDQHGGSPHDQQQHFYDGHAKYSMSTGE